MSIMSFKIAVRSQAQLSHRPNPSRMEELRAPVASPLVISIQSQVVHGHVGNSAAVFPMQAAGIRVAAVPTTLFSNNPHYPTLRGRIVDSDLLEDLLLGIDERGLVEQARILVTGYLGSRENALVVANFVARAKARNPSLCYVCDPVMGDADVGIYVAAGIREAFVERLIPLADIITPNQFELGLVVGGPVDDIEAVIASRAVFLPMRRLERSRRFSWRTAPHCASRRLGSHCDRPARVISSLLTLSADWPGEPRWMPLSSKPST